MATLFTRLRAATGGGRTALLELLLRLAAEWGGFYAGFMADVSNGWDAGMDDAQLDGTVDVFHQAAAIVAAYRRTLRERRVTPTRSVDEVAADLGWQLPAGPTPPGEVINLLAEAAEGGLMASAGPRYFGFVVGGSLPAATAADVLAVGWDQNCFNSVASPAAGAAEQVAGAWLKDLLTLPSSASTGFVTGAQAANTAGLAAARHRVLGEVGWDVEQRGLLGAPTVHVIASEERHATIDRSLRLLGLGNDCVIPVSAAANGAIDTDHLAEVLAQVADDGRSQASGQAAPIVCLQAGNVNTGACDDLRTAIALVREHAGWAHVDGAFGLWAAASAQTRHLVDGVELADSWGCDGHKWLNLPYDSGFAFCAHPEVAAIAMSYTAAYLTGSGTVSGMGDLTAESSRRARGFAAWAALRELGRDGVEELVDRCCTLAQRFAAGLAAGGAEIVNDVVLNQVLVGFADARDETTVTNPNRIDSIAEAIQQDGTCWLGATTWRGRRLLRVSVSNHSTSIEDIDRSVAAVLRAAAQGS